MITSYLNQQAQYESLASSNVDIYGVGDYNAPVTVACRREARLVEIKDKSGRVVLSTVTYFLDSSVIPAVNEKLDGRRILEVLDYVVGSGTLIGWEVYT